MPLETLGSLISFHLVQLLDFESRTHWNSARNISVKTVFSRPRVPAASFNASVKVNCKRTIGKYLKVKLFIKEVVDTLKCLKLDMRYGFLYSYYIFAGTLEVMTELEVNWRICVHSDLAVILYTLRKIYQHHV